jgi:phage shock protein A
MSIWSKLFTLGRARRQRSATAVVDKNAIRILDQEIRGREDRAGQGARQSRDPGRPAPHPGAGDQELRDR